MKNSELARRYGLGLNAGKSSNMFIDGDAIYSYGYHFCIARRLNDNNYLFNSMGYSRTTSKHKRYVENALSYKNLIHLQECKLKNVYNQILKNGKELSDITNKQLRARTPHMIEYYKTRTAWLINQIEQLDKLRSLKEVV